MQDLLLEGSHILAYPDVRFFDVSFQALGVAMTAPANRARYLDKIHSTETLFVDRSSISVSVLATELAYYISLLSKLGCDCV
jgi:hypothetical protein